VRSGASFPQLPGPPPRGDHHLIIALLAWRLWTGTYKEVAGNVSCFPCPSNTSSPGGNASCFPCPINASSPAGSAACLCNPVSGPGKGGRERDDGRERKMRDKEKKTLSCLQDSNSALKRAARRRKRAGKLLAAVIELSSKIERSRHLTRTIPRVEGRGAFGSRAWQFLLSLSLSLSLSLPLSLSLFLISSDACFRYVPPSLHLMISLLYASISSLLLPCGGGMGTFVG
jgi:hypothetical protein